MVEPEVMAETANKWVDSIKALSAPALVLVFLNGLGVLLKSNKRIDNDWIPALLVGLGALAYMAVGNSEDIPYKVNWVWAYKAMFGAILGLGSVGLHQVAGKLFGWNRGPETPKT